MSTNGVNYSSGDAQNRTSVKYGKPEIPLPSKDTLILTTDCITCRQVCTNVLACKTKHIKSI